MLSFRTNVTNGIQLSMDYFLCFLNVHAIFKWILMWIDFHTAFQFAHFAIDNKCDYENA